MGCYKLTLWYIALPVIFYSVSQKKREKRRKLCQVVFVILGCIPVDKESSEQVELYCTVIAPHL